MKRSISQKNGILLVWAVLLSLLLLPFIIISGIHTIGRFDEWRYQQSDSFISEKWIQKNLKYRFSTLNEVAEHRLNVGMSSEAVSKLLGQPDRKIDASKWQYDALRPGWRFFGFEGGGLLVSFDDSGNIEDIENNYWID